MCCSDSLEYLEKGIGDSQKHCRAFSALRVRCSRSTFRIDGRDNFLFPVA
jgi:hypothetical protein